jgi:hypothetical protein
VFSVLGKCRVSNGGRNFGLFVLTSVVFSSLELCSVSQFWPICIRKV